MKMMVNILKYDELINETRLTIEKQGYHLELNDKGKLLPPFSYYYDPMMHDEYYFVIKSIHYNEYRPVGNRVTLLDGSIYLDTDVNRRGEFLVNLDFDENNYYFYQIYSTPRRIREIHGVSVRYNDEPDRFNVQLTADNKLHFVVIEKNKNISTVRLNSGGRFGAGDRAEKIISDKFGMRLDKTKIKINLVKNDYGDVIIPDNDRKAVLSDILKMDINMLRRYENIFELTDIDDDTINKHDLVIMNGDDAGKKIEVKKYSAKELFVNRNRHSVDILVAEQLATSTKPGLRKLVNLYGEVTNVDVSQLLVNYNIDGGNELSNFFSSTYRGVHRRLIDNIRIFYNGKMLLMKKKYDQIPKDKIMTNVHGIYFFNNESGVDGFLIKNENINLVFYWEIKIKEWGLYKISLVVNVNPNAKRYVWLGDLNMFVETFRVGDTDLIPSKNGSIIEDTSMGDIKWNGKKGYWTVISEKPDKKIKTIKLKSYKSKNSS